MNEEEGREGRKNKTKNAKKNNNNNHPRQQKNKQTHSFFVCINYSLFHSTIYIVILHYMNVKKSKVSSMCFLYVFFF